MHILSSPGFPTEPILSGFSCSRSCFSARTSCRNWREGLGKSLGEFKKAKEEFEKEVHAAAEPDAKIGDKAPHISGNLPQSVEPAAPGTATSVDELTKKS